MMLKYGERKIQRRYGQSLEVLWICLVRINQTNPQKYKNFSNERKSWKRKVRRREKIFKCTSSPQWKAYKNHEKSQKSFFFLLQERLQTCLKYNKSQWSQNCKKCQKDSGYQDFIFWWNFALVAEYIWQKVKTSRNWQKKEKYEIWKSENHPEAELLGLWEAVAGVQGFYISTPTKPPPAPEFILQFFILLCFFVPFFCIFCRFYVSDMTISKILLSLLS